MVRLRIDLAYDGGAFHGWATQPGMRTVQGEIEDVLHTVLRVPRSPEHGLRLTVAGRTDTGVHAAHQVCHFDVDEHILEGCIGHMNVPAHEALCRRLSRMVPSDIAIHNVTVAPEGFDARFSACERTYVYRINDNDRSVDPRMRGFVLALHDSLDIDAMNAAAALMVGLHDFGSFAIPHSGGTTIRKVISATWTRLGERALVEGSGEPAAYCGAGYAVPASESGLVVFTIAADAFARNMVRSLVNACVAVGLGKRDVAWFRSKIDTPQREGVTGPIAPHGLTLEHVAYPPDNELATRAQNNRAQRTL